MAEKKDYIKVGKRHKVKDHYVFESGLIPNYNYFGFTAARQFKDEEIYFNEPDEICFIGDMGFDKLLNYYMRNPFAEEDPMVSYENYLYKNEVQMCAIETEEDKAYYYKQDAWSHNHLLEESEKFLNKHKKYDYLNPEELAYKVFIDAQFSIKTFSIFENTPLYEPDSFSAAAKKLKK